MKSGEKAWTDLSCDACRCWRHVQSAHIRFCFLSFTLLDLNSVRSFCSVCPARPIATGSIMASYSTWRQQQHASHDKSVQAFSLFFILQATKAGCRGPPTKSFLVQRQSPISHSYTVDDQRLQIQFRCVPTRATENPISTPDFSQQPMLTRKKSRWWRPRSLDKKTKHNGVK